jgi:hypothetical protein
MPDGYRLVGKSLVPVAEGHVPASSARWWLIPAAIALAFAAGLSLLFYRLKKAKGAPAAAPSRPGSPKKSG